jgi:hypothetical protein
MLYLGSCLKGDTLKDTSKCVVGEAYGFSSSYILIANGVLKLVGSLCFTL